MLIYIYIYIRFGALGQISPLWPLVASSGLQGPPVASRGLQGPPGASWGLRGFPLTSGRTIVIVLKFQIEHCDQISNV